MQRLTAALPVDSGKYQNELLSDNFDSSAANTGDFFRLNQWHHGIPVNRLGYSLV